MYITCKPSVQFCTFPHSVYKGTKPTDFFVTAASQCNDENKKTNDNSNHKTNDNSNDKTNDNDDEDFKEEHECKVASQIGTQDLLDHPNFYPELRDSGMYNVINNMKKVNHMAEPTFYYSNLLQIFLHHQLLFLDAIRD